MRYLLSTLTGIVSMLMLLIPAANGEVFNVSDATGLQAALTAAETNDQDDTINVAAGTYNVVTKLTHFGDAFETFALTITGAGAATTILDGGNAVQIMLLYPGGDLTVSGLTFRNGDDTAGSVTPSGGLAVNGDENGTTTVLSDCVFTGNGNTSTGGGFNVEDEMVSISNVTVSDNSSGGIGGGAYASGNTSLAISNSTFTNNSTGLLGGGLYARGGIVTITDSTFSGNTVDDDGEGGGLLLTTGSTFTVTGSTFSNNSADSVCNGTGRGHGAGASITPSGTVTAIISENTFSNNGVPCGAGGGGGGLHVSTNGAGEIRVINNFFFNNASGTPGAGVSGGAVLLESQVNAAVNVTNNTFSGNDSGDGTADIVVSVKHALGSTNIYNNIFWGPAGDDSLAVLDDNGAPVRIFNNDIDINSVTLTNGGDYQSGGNLNVDPLYADMAGGDLHLTETSSVIDKGLNTAPAIPTVDFDGDARILEGTVDMGADEFTAAVVPPPPPADPPSAPFNPGTGVLVIPELQLSPTKAYRVELVRLNEPGYVFELQNFSKVTATSNPAGTFSLKTGVLEIFAVQIGASAKTWNVLMQKRPGVYVFDMTSAKKN